MMTNVEKLAAVRKKIVEACPECKEYIYCVACDTGFIHEPRLDHVLRALGQVQDTDWYNRTVFWNEKKNYFNFVYIDQSKKSIGLSYSGDRPDDVIWFPNTDLSGQPEATIDFLYSVLCSK